MNKHIKKLLVAVLAISATHAHANTRYTNQTFLSPRPIGVNLPMGQTAFHELYARKVGHTFGGNIQVTGFYQSSAEAKDTARYFLFNNKDSITLNKVGAAGTGLSTAEDLDLGYLIHDRADATNRSAKVTLRPKQQSYGIRLDYHQDLSKVLNGLFFYANTSVVYVENDPQLSISSSDAFADGTVASAGVSAPVKTVLTQYFNGTFANTAVDANLQSKLTNARINGKQSARNLADIDLGIGYTFVDKERIHLSLAIAGTLPTGNTAEGVYMFEPIAGNGKHFAIGGDANACARIWGRHDHNVKLAIAAKYRYLFEHNEKRTLGIKGKNWSQYHLLVKAGLNGQSLTPAANVLTQNVDITPGGQFDGVFNFCYNNCNFTFDLGYNLYLREHENIKLRDAFIDGQYAIAARNVEANGDFTATLAFTTGLADVTDGGAIGAASILTTANLDLDRARTPSQCTHGIYTSMGYNKKEGENPWLIAVGGKYDFASRNSMYDQWGVWGKVGIGF